MLDKNKKRRQRIRMRNRQRFQHFVRQMCAKLPFSVGSLYLTKAKKKTLKPLWFQGFPYGCGGRTWTYDLRVMSYGSGIHLALLCAILPVPLGFQILFSTVLSTVSTENFCSLGQNMGQKPRSRSSAETRLRCGRIWCCDSSLNQENLQELSCNRLCQ